MTEKLSTVILKVDLHCSSCNKKIKKTLCKLQDREKIRSVVYDDKKSIVTILGPFDPKKLIKKICCKACNVIQDIQIVEDKPKPKPAADPPPPPPEDKKPDPPPPAPEPAPPVPAPAPAPAPEPPAPAPAPEPEPKKPDPEPKKVEPEPPKPEPVAKPPETAQPYPTPVWTPGSGCCCRPWFEAYYGGCRCCSCGWIYGPVTYCPPPPVVYGYGGPCCDGPKTCEFICEEQPSICRIM